MSNILIILFPNQLFQLSYLENVFQYKEEGTESSHTIPPISHICLWEHPYFFNKFPYHKMKLLFHRASMKNYFDDIPSKYKKLYVEWNEKESATIQKYIQRHRITEIRIFNPIEKELIQLIVKDKILPTRDKRIFSSPYFLNSSTHETNARIAEQISSSRHDVFYKYQRIEYNVMVHKKGDKYVPDGSKWSFDTENRLPFEKTQIEPTLLHFASKTRAKYLQEAEGYVVQHFSTHYGDIDLDQFIYPINHEECMKWLSHFIAHKLFFFGKYEDAMSSKIKFGYHSVLSPLTNIGLITPFDILKQVNGYKKNIASKEGFIRQVIGWREYCYFTYDLFGDHLKSNTLYDSNRQKIPKKVWESATQIPPIDNILRNVSATGYSHHIERLMGIGNFLILIGVEPQEIYNWFHTMYIDAYDVFMVPNVYGMLCYGKLDNKSHMMTRPYFASSNYLMKMSDYKSEECVEIEDQKYKWDEVMDALYWSHISDYSTEFRRTYATASSVIRWEKMNVEKKRKYRELSNVYKKWIHHEK